MSDMPARSDGPALRPLGRFVGDLGPLLRRCLPALAAVSAAGWLPATAALALTLASGVDLEILAGVIDPARLVSAIDGSVPLPPVVTGSAGLLVLGVVATLVLYFLGQAFVSNASGFLLERAAAGGVCRSADAVGWALRRLPRTLGALGVSLTATMAPLACLVAVMAAGLPGALVPAAALVALAATLRIAARFTLTGVTAAIAPPDVPVLQASAGAVSGRWLAVLTRVLVVSVLASVAASAVSLPLLAAGAATGQVVLAVAFAVRVVLSMAGTSFALASGVLMYRDLGLPVDDRIAG